MRNRIPDILKERNMELIDLEYLIHKNGGSLSKNTLASIADESAAGKPLPPGTRVGTLIAIAKALNVSLSELAEAELV